MTTSSHDLVAQLIELSNQIGSDTEYTRSGGGNSSAKTGDTLLILEAMKMQNEIPAVSDGTVSAISVSAGQSVKAGDPLVTVG